MNTNDEIRCWLRLRMHPAEEQNCMEIGCTVCEGIRSVMYIHVTNPKHCNCRKENWDTEWHGYHGYASTMWPTCEDCIKEHFDVVLVSPEISGMMRYSFCDSYPVILADKLKPIRNAKRANP